MNHLPPHKDLRLENGELREEFLKIQSERRDVNHQATETQPGHHAKALASRCLSGLVSRFSTKVRVSRPTVAANNSLLRNAMLPQIRGTMSSIPFAFGAGCPKKG